MSLKNFLIESEPSILSMSRVVRGETPENLRMERVDELIKFMESSLNLKFKKIYAVGEGNYGNVYKVNNKALKLGSEFTYHSIDLEKLIKDNPRGFIKVYNFVHVPKSLFNRDNISITIMELVENGEIGFDEFIKFKDNKINWASFGFEKPFKARHGHDINNFIDAIEVALLDGIEVSDWENIFKEIMEKESEKLKTTIYIDLWYAAHWTLKNGFRYADLHRGNILHDKKKNEYKLIDVL